MLPNLYVYGTPNPRDGDYKFCSPRISAEMSGGKALGLEGVITFLLTMSFCGMWDLRNEKWIDSRPLRLGVIISGLTIAAVRTNVHTRLHNVVKNFSGLLPVVS